MGTGVFPLNKPCKKNKQTNRRKLHFISRIYFGTFDSNYFCLINTQTKKIVLSFVVFGKEKLLALGADKWNEDGRKKNK